MPSGRLDADVRAAVVGRLHAAGQRMTMNREALLVALAAAPRPLTMTEILEARPNLATSSAYRNLVVLEQAGAVHRLVTSNDFARYELAEGLTEHHHHLVCTSCGAVEDVHAPDVLEESVRRAAASIQRRTGFRVDRHRVDLLGLCERCFAAGRSADGAGRESTGVVTADRA
jgi:Fe2+ or Zn2+ uptake regulation protein